MRQPEGKEETNMTQRFTKRFTNGMMCTMMMCDDGGSPPGRTGGCWFVALRTGRDPLGIPAFFCAL